jgi:hypothetical protein
MRRVKELSPAEKAALAEIKRQDKATKAAKRKLDEEENIVTVSAARMRIGVPL